MVTSVSMDFFRKLFTSVRNKDGRSIAMISDDGTLLASSPAPFGDGELTALSHRTATSNIASPVDGVYRVGSPKHLYTIR